MPESGMLYLVISGARPAKLRLVRRWRVRLIDCQSVPPSWILAEELHRMLVQQQPHPLLKKLAEGSAVVLLFTRLNHSRVSFQSTKASSLAYFTTLQALPTPINGGKKLTFEICCARKRH